MRTADKSFPGSPRRLPDNHRPLKLAPRLHRPCPGRSVRPILERPDGAALKGLRYLATGALIGLGLAAIGLLAG